MKTITNTSKGILLALLFVSACAAAMARAGERDARVISAHAGGVNFVAGDVRVRRSGALEWRALSATDELKSGDTVTAGADGRVEILLNPGSYFRAGAGAEFTLADTNLDDLRLELARGSAVVEATGYDGLDLAITLATPRATVHIVRTGVYRVNALADGEAEVAVFEGRAFVGGTMVKGGKVARTGAAGVVVSKLDKKERDGLDLWSRDRGKDLAKANEKMTRRTLRTLFARNSFDQLFGPYGQTLGFWAYSDRTQCYTFIPFSAYWRSPYGYWYGTGVIIPYPTRPWSGGAPPPPGWTPPGTSGGTPQPQPQPQPGGTWSGGGSNGGSGQGAAPPSRPMPDPPIERAPPTPHIEKNPPSEQPRPRDQR
jgi:hypothetical protein